MLCHRGALLVRERKRERERKRGVGLCLGDGFMKGGNVNPLSYSSQLCVSSSVTGVVNFDGLAMNFTL